MKIGDVLNGYEIVTSPTNAGGGMSQWSFATKDGNDYFVKMFLAPKFPLDDGPGSPGAKQRKRAVCLAFEQRHLEIARRLDPSTPGAGNLVVPVDFFRVESTYVKVMERVIATELPPASDLTSLQLQVLLRSLCFSLRMLHSQSVVHGDLKPDNVMVERSGADLLVSKLIDFDEAYVVGAPPPPEQIVGDPSYYSPELLRYIKKDGRLPQDALSTASDIFSLGLLLHVLLTGGQPAFDRTRANYPAEVVLARSPLDITTAPTIIQPLLARMLALVPGFRPSIQDVIDFLADVDAGDLLLSAPSGTGLPASSAVGVSQPSPSPPRSASINPATPVTSPPTPSSGLRSTMGRRR